MRRRGKGTRAARSAVPRSRASCVHGGAAARRRPTDAMTVAHSPGAVPCRARPCALSPCAVGPHTATPRRCRTEAATCTTARPNRPAEPDAWVSSATPQSRSWRSAAAAVPGSMPQMLGDEPCRARRDPKTVDPLRVKDEILEDDPRLRSERPHQRAGIRPDNDAAFESGDDRPRPDLSHGARSPPGESARHTTARPGRW